MKKEREYFNNYFDLLSSEIKGIPWKHCQRYGEVNFYSFVI